MGGSLHFPALRDNPADKTMTELLKSLVENFNNFRIPRQVLLLVRNLLAVSVSGSCPAEAKAMLPAVDKGAFQLDTVQLRFGHSLSSSVRAGEDFDSVQVRIRVGVLASQPAHIDLRSHKTNFSKLSEEMRCTHSHSAVRK